VCKNTIIRKIFLPKMPNIDEIKPYYDILICAEKYNIIVELYNFDTNVEICNDVLFNYSIDNGFSLIGKSAELKKQGEDIICIYNNVCYDVGYSDGVSKKIPLN
jgi:hypothetical protein